MNRILLGWAALLMSVGAQAAGAQAFDTVLPLDPPGTNANTNPGLGFGGGVSLHGDLILVGAYEQSQFGDGPGHAYLFDATSGVLLRTLNNPSADPVDDAFGGSVSLTAQYALVGAPYDTVPGVAADAGSAYLFDVATGNLLHTFPNPSPSTLGKFGASVSVSGNYVLIGSPGDDTLAANTGRAFLYDAVTGNLLQTLDNPSPDAEDQFGARVAISGNRVLIGAPYDDIIDINHGRAYLFDAVTGNLVHTLENPDPSTKVADRFGAGVSVDGDRLLVGAPGWDATSYYVNSGKAFLFDAVTGNLQHSFENPVIDGQGGFGGSGLSVHGDKLLIGVLNDVPTTSWSSRGEAYLYDANTGAQLQRIDNPDPTLDVFDGFGASVSMHGSRLLIGAPGADEAGGDAGRAYLYFDGLPVEVAAEEEVHPNHDDENVSPYLDDVIPVIVYGADSSKGDDFDLDPVDINPATLRFGPGRGGIKPGSLPVYSVDYNADTVLDAQFEFLTSDTDIGCGFSDAALDGETITGERLASIAQITTDCDALCHK